MYLRRLLLTGVVISTTVTSLGSAAQAEPLGEAPSDQTTVEILLESGADAEQDARAAVAAAGGTVSGSVPGHIVQATLPVAALNAVEDAPGVRFVRPPQAQGQQIDPPRPATDQATPPNPLAGTGGELAHTNAAAWHAAGYRGAGVRIGIIDGFDGAAWSASVASGDLPELDPSHTLCIGMGDGGPGQPCDIWQVGITHGVGVAELVHEVAPDAELFIATALTAADMQTAVDWFADNGVTVINRSLGGPIDGPGDGTGPQDAVADSAVAQGMAFFNAAGNEAGRGTNGHYYRAPYTGDASGLFHLFVAPEDGGSPVPAGGPHPLLGMRCELLVDSSLRWTDWDTDQPTDYALLVFADPLGTRLIGASFEDQSNGAPPIDHAVTFCLPGTSVYLAVAVVSPGDGTDGDVLEIFGQSPLEMWSNPHSVGYPIVDSTNPGVFAIGANEADHSIAYYSSQGPTNDGRTKPDFTARSNVESNTLGTFQGTSASSPIAAGLAALVLGAGIADSPTTLRQWLIEHAAVDRGAAGPDNDFGQGELILPEPPVRAILPIEPARVLDTRGGATFDGSFTAGGRAAAGTPVVVPVAGFGQIPGSARGIVANLTAVFPDEPGYATLYPCDQSPPTASHVNYQPGEVVANNVVVPLAGDGSVCIYSSSAADFALDVSGFVPDGSAIRLFAAQRYLDTRAGQPTFDGRNAGLGAYNGRRVIQVAGRGGIPADARAAIVSVTAVNPRGEGFVTVDSCEGDPARASTINFGPGQFVPNGAVTQLSPDGKLCVYSSAVSDITVDVSGYVPTGTAGLTTSAPARLFDTRTDGVTVDAEYVGWGAMPANSSGTIGVVRRARVPAGATGAIVNVAAIGPDSSGFITVWPCGDLPQTSSLNFAAGGTRANNAIVKLNEAGDLCIYSLAGTHAIVDITGWLF